MSSASGYCMHPTLHGDTIVFVCEEDLWTVPVAGGTARRLTTARGVATHPQLSPDGRRLAYAARDEGPMEVYVMDAEGGPAQRVSHHGVTMTHPVGWRPDGKAVIFRSNAGRPFLAQHWLYEAVPGRAPKRIEIGPARSIAYEPNGKGRVIGINSGDPARWKRYRGGTAGQIWIDRKGTGTFEPLVELEGNLANPMWIGKRVYFLSDHEGTANLYSCTPTGRSLQRHTDHEEFFARFPQTDGKRIVYHAGGDLYVFDPRSGTSQHVPIEMQSARTGRARRFVPAGASFQSGDLHPEGHSLAVVARGGAFTMGLWEGAPVRHGPVSSARSRLARWLPDGKRIVRVSDESGEEGLIVCKADGTGRPKHLKLDIGRVLSMEVAPAGKDRVAITNHRQEVLIVDLGSRARRVVERSEHDRIGGIAWSPDGRWLAYGFPVHRTASAIHLHDAQRNKTHAITRPDFRDFAPSFDPGGRYLCFLSSRVYDPVYDNQVFDLGFPRAILPCLVPLRKDMPSPFAAATRTPRAPSENGGGGARKLADKVDVDLKGIADRVVALPMPEQRYWSIEAGYDRIYTVHDPIPGSLGSGGWRAGGAPPAKSILQAFDFDKQKAETVSDGMTGFALSMNRKTLLLRVGNRLRALAAPLSAKGLPTASGVTRESGWLDLERLRVAVDPGAEWGQMFDEAWRLQRDQFWSADMTDVDWQGVYDRYRPLVDRVASRTEFSDLIWEMQGELGTSHNYELAGDYKPEPRWFQGVLGADIAWSTSRKQWVIEHIAQGDSWVAGGASPLAAPGLGISEGDAIVAVGETTLSSKLSPEMCLVNEAGRPVVLTVVARKRGKSTPKPRRVTVQTIANDQMVRYREWVETNRAHVHKASKGTVGYVHIPNMGPWGFSEFHRYFHHEVDKLGLIVDVRYNGGGHVSQLLLQKLNRRRVGYGLSRWMGIESYPADAPMGPMVALTNENAGSDGDIFSHCFKLYKLGTLIGKRTWGGVVGIWPRHSLVDGTITTQSEFAHWFEDVGWTVENYGTDPDMDVGIKPQDWAAGRDPQMEAGLKEVQRLIRTLKPKIPDLGPKPSMKPPRLPKRP